MQIRPLKVITINFMKQSKPQHWNQTASLIDNLINNANINAEHQASPTRTRPNHCKLIKNQRYHLSPAEKLIEEMPSHQMEKIYYKSFTMDLEPEMPVEQLPPNQKGATKHRNRKNANIITIVILLSIFPPYKITPASSKKSEK